MSKKREEQNRRDFLKKMTLGVSGAMFMSPMELMLRSIINGASVNAHAQDAGIKPRKYLYIQQTGGPSRWVFDLPLALSDEDKAKLVLTNKGMVNRFAGGGTYNEAIYETWKHTPTGFHLPWMWQYNIPTASGGSRPMTDLLQNMMVIRGVNTGNTAHNGAGLLHFHPAGINQSLTSLSADADDYPIACVNVGSSYHSFVSTKGKSHIDLPERGTDQLNVLLKPFEKMDLAQFSGQQNLVKGAIDGALDVFDSLAIDRHVNIVAAKEARQGAEEMMNTGFGNVEGYYQATYAKYQTLVRSALTGYYVGLNDKAISNVGGRAVRNNGYYIRNNDLRTLIGNDTTVSNLAAHFTTAEFILTRGISNSVVISPYMISSMNVVSDDAVPSWNRYHNADAHSAGNFSTTFCSSFTYIAYAACLMELIETFKSAGIFDETVIDFCGEFGREPHHETGRTDHSPRANSNTLFCGAIQGPHVIGNIVKEDNDSYKISNTYIGTYGVQGNNPDFGYLSIKHFGKTLATMLRTEVPLNVPSLVEEVNGVIKPLLPKGKIVDS
jgi:hypothetical protein